jgi:peptidyl-prolyl cis-trans isomerase D
MKFFRKHMRTILLVTLVGLLAGIFIGFGGYFFGGKYSGDAVAEVNGVKIPYAQYSNLFNRAMENMRSSNAETSDKAIEQKKTEVMQDLIQEEIFFQEAKKYGIEVLDEEVAADVSRFPAFQREGKFSQELYFRVLSWQLRMSPKDFEESRRKQIAMAKLRYLIASSVKITDNELGMEYAIQNAGNMKNFEKDKDKFMKEMLEKKTMAVFNEWYKSIQNSVKVKVFNERLKE